MISLLRFWSWVYGGWCIFGFGCNLVLFIQLFVAKCRVEQNEVVVFNKGEALDKLENAGTGMMGRIIEYGAKIAACASILWFIH